MTLERRLNRLVMGYIYLVDALVGVLTFGIIWPNLALKYSRYYAKKGFEKANKENKIRVRESVW